MKVRQKTFDVIEFIDLPNKLHGWLEVPGNDCYIRLWIEDWFDNDEYWAPEPEIQKLWKEVYEQTGKTEFLLHVSW